MGTLPEPHPFGFYRDFIAQLMLVDEVGRASRAWLLCLLLGLSV
jgi:hypothetical protein